MSLIYRVTTQAEWKAALEKGFYESASLAAEGFIHCSEEHQVAGFLERYFKNKTELVKLVIKTGKLTSRCVHEWSPSVQHRFPHIFGTINLDALVDSNEL